MVERRGEDEPYRLFRNAFALWCASRLRRLGLGGGAHETVVGARVCDLDAARLHRGGEHFSSTAVT